jgi:hypothetical protein
LTKNVVKITTVVQQIMTAQWSCVRKTK